MQDLQEVTQEMHYENFRSEKLAGGATPAAMRKSKSVDDISIRYSFNI